jgi:uncharacterized membrane protein YwzB
MLNSSTSRIYLPQQVGVAAGLGGPLAGAVLLKLNYRALGEQPIGALPVAWGFALTLVLVILALRGHGGGAVLSVWIGFSYWRYANHLQGAAISERISNGTLGQGWLRTVFIAVAILLGTAVVAFLLRVLLEAQGFEV